MQQIRECPRCGAALPDETYLEEMKAAEGRLPAYRLRHPVMVEGKQARTCVAYVGPEAFTPPSDLSADTN